MILSPFDPVPSEIYSESIAIFRSLLACIKIGMLDFHSEY